MYFHYCETSDGYNWKNQVRFGNIENSVVSVAEYEKENMEIYRM